MHHIKHDQLYKIKCTKGSGIIITWKKIYEIDIHKKNICSKNILI